MSGDASALDAEAAARIETVCSALGLPISAIQMQALTTYLRMLQRWNGIYNLTAVRDPAQMLTQHLADCLAVVPSLQRRMAGLQGCRVLDVGSGGGLPAAVLAVMCPGALLTSVDAVGKKAAFVRQVAGSLPLANLHAVHARVEELRAPAFDVITARAFSSLSDFVALTAKHLAPSGVWMAMKGKPPEDEIAALPGEIEVFHVEHLAVPGLDAARCLVWMRPSMACVNPAGAAA